MAFYTNKIVSPRKTKLSSLKMTCGQALRRLAAAQNRSAVVARMQTLDDCQLSAMGLSRDEIVRYVYRDICYV